MNNYRSHPALRGWLYQQNSRNFCRLVQQLGKSFDDFCITLRELVKTWRLCSYTCAQNGICDQIIEGLIDGNTIEGLLREVDLILTTTIAKCRSCEATRENQFNIVVQDTETPKQNCGSCRMKKLTQWVLEDLSWH